MGTDSVTPTGDDIRGLADRTDRCDFCAAPVGATFVNKTVDVLSSIRGFIRLPAGRLWCSNLNYLSKH